MISNNNPRLPVPGYSSIASSGLDNYGFRQDIHRSPDKRANYVISVIGVIDTEVSGATDRHCSMKHAVVYSEPFGLVLDNDDLAVAFATVRFVNGHDA
ncbi:unnamed protein product [Euphydryas editha]|uniref:Uncharacterized protein n=1 Tax=Euphydryas editha TaxID=104508 RepID=A0AAU9TR72_EUPED|nr:unnamed protein product [Euphydryas editha]